MAFASKFVLVSSLLVVFLMINIKPSSSQTTDELIDEICRATEDFGFCTGTFNTHLKAPNADIVALTQITIEVASDQATQTLSFIRQTLTTTTDPALKKALTECQDAYALITQQYGSAAVAFFQKDYSSVEKDERPTARVEASCEATLSAPPNNQQHILDDRSKQMRIFIVMSVNAVETLLRMKTSVNLAQAGAPAPM
ncbi:PREDICTED: putative invertase inhibitor [Fragaria vesca subsp. vesca]|uniref:putative invertase inhibitor n=1 Tax=Fragaria vesca subsp. vesca TaxID=101020 RepID=UPI0002C37556|nr:PREDICTED: putative invertase inhibitor [Fragaria vesca subsp. vesca]